MVTQLFKLVMSFYDYVTKEYKRIIVVYKENVPKDQICDPLDDFDIKINKM